MKVGDYVTWPDHDIDSEGCGLWQVARVGYLVDGGPHKVMEQGVTIRWIGGFRRYPDQKRAMRLLKHVRLVDDPLVAITKLVENEMEVLALVAKLP